MRDRKWRIETFSFYDRTGIEAHLEKMAEKGWDLDKITRLGWRYRRTAPKKMHFIVTYYPKASAYDPAPSEGEQTFQDFCAEAGWRLIASSAQLQIFGNEQESPVPIETDAALQVETIHNAVKKSYLLSYFLLLAVGIMNIVLFIYRLQLDPIGVLASNTNLFTGTCFSILIVLSLTEIIGYFNWYRKAKLAATMDGSFIKTRGHHRFQIALVFVMLIALIWWAISLELDRDKFIFFCTAVYMAAFILLINAIKSTLKRKKAAAATNRTITIIAAFVLSFAMMGGLTAFILHAASSGWLNKSDAAESYVYNGHTWNVYKDELPLAIEDLQATSYDEYSYELTVEASPFLTHYEATQRPKMGALDVPYLEYTVTQVKLPLIYDLCLGSLAERYTDEEAAIMGYRLAEQDASIWDADTVYRCYSGEYPLDKYIICWSDRIAVVSLDWEPTPEQIMIIAKKIKAM